MLELNFNPFPILETERLTLRKVTMNDSQDVYKLRTSIEAMRYIGRPIPHSISEAHDLINRIKEGIETNTAIGWGIFLKKQSQLIGTIGYHKIEKEHYRAEIGYMLIPEFWNKGLMSEAIKQVLEFGFKTIKLHSIQANIDPANQRSAAILNKFGFVKEAYFKESFYFNGKFLDSEIYSLLKKHLDQISRQRFKEN